jgi:L-amino acid N-acyltransferase YncA
VIVREARPEDAAAVAAVYAPYITDSVASFEYEPPSAEDMARRMAASHLWLVADDGPAGVVGYAYASQHKTRRAYDWAADLGIYIAGTHTGRGVGRALYDELLPRLRALGLRQLCAGVSQPNDASDALHRRLGFREVGVYERIGWKFGRWIDVRWWQLDLADGDLAPPGTLGG